MAEAGASESDAASASASGATLPFDPSAKPAKSILKTSRRSSKPLQWDEMNILMTEHPPDKDYGHMKIDEPPTPYNREYEDEDMEAGGSGDPVEEPLDGAALEKLVEARAKEEDGTWESRQKSTEDDEDEDDDLTPEAKAKKKAFTAKRKQHYNEFEMVKRMREKRQAGRKSSDDEEE
eukprot:scpid99506/ scgid6843/ Protein phosphatase inhibitor 2